MKILPPEVGWEHPAHAARRPIAWVVALIVAVAALVAVVVVEETRIGNRDDRIAALIAQRDVAVRDLQTQLATALQLSETRSARIGELRSELRGMERVAGRDVARLEARAAIFQARSERLKADLEAWMAPLPDGSYAGYLYGVNATSDPARIVFEIAEGETSGTWHLLPASPTATVTVWSYPREDATSTERPEDLAFLDQMYSMDTRWAEHHRAAWYRIVVSDGEVTQIEQAPPTP